MFNDHMLSPTYGYGADAKRGELSAQVLQRLYEVAQKYAQRTYELAWATEAFTKARQEADKAHNLAIKERNLIKQFRDAALKGIKIYVVDLGDIAKKDRYAKILRSAGMSTGTTLSTAFSLPVMRRGAKGAGGAGGAGGGDTSVLPTLLAPPSAAADAGGGFMGLSTTTLLLGAGVLVAGYFLLGRKKTAQRGV